LYKHLEHVSVNMSPVSICAEIIVTDLHPVLDAADQTWGLGAHTARKPLNRRSDSIFLGQLDEW
jgi:hypothetical protein